MTAPTIASHPLAHRDGIALMFVFFIVSGVMCETYATTTVRVNKVKRRCPKCKTTVDWVRDTAEANRRMDEWVAKAMSRAATKEPAP